MIMTIGEYIRQSDEKLAIVITILMRMKSVKNAEEMQNFKISEDDVAWMLSYLKQPFEPGKPLPWMH